MRGLMSKRKHNKKQSRERTGRIYDFARKDRTNLDEFSRMQRRAKKKGKSQQPSSSIAEHAESPTDQDVEEGKDFGTLINAPLSKGGHFVFKSEKAWTVDSSQYSEFFTLNLKALSAAIDCVPFNEYVDVADKYFVVSTREIFDMQEILVKFVSCCCTGLHQKFSFRFFTFDILSIYQTYFLLRDASSFYLCYSFNTKKENVFIDLRLLSF